MGGWLRAFTLGVAATSLVACAALSGLDQYSNAACSDDCGADVTVGGDAADVQGGDVGVSDGTARDDAASDAPTQEASGDASDGGSDTGKDAPPDCDATGTVQNCSACGDTCDTMTGMPSCNGSTCSYACNGNLLDCNANTPPDLDGCECATPACCGQKCQTTHSDGLGQTFYDCAPLATYNATQALEACAAYTGNMAECASGYKCGNAYAACSAGAAVCDCWAYSGGVAGHVGTSVNTTCYCPLASDPKWN